MSLPVCDLSASAQKLAKRLLENPGGIPVQVGWDGQQISVFASTYKAPVKSLPHAKLVIPFAALDEEVEQLLMQAVAELLVSLPKALASGARRPTTAKHAWRSSSIARRGGGD